MRSTRTAESCIAKRRSFRQSVSADVSTQIMNLVSLNSQLGATLIGAIAGILLGTLIQVYFRRRGLCTYFVTHNRAAVSADDPIFGSVRVTWQGTEVSNLYVSTAELRNESINDYENVRVRLYTNNTTLLNERTQVLGSPDILKWTEDYKRQIAPDSSGNVSDVQRGMYWTQREYLIPVLNRSGRIQFEYVNIAGDTNEQPSIWMSINHKGLALSFRIPQPEILGVSHRRASLVGIFACAILIAAITYSSSKLMAATMLAFFVGVFVLVPGALIIRSGSWLIRKVIG